MLLVAATISWLLSLPLRNVAIVEPLWSLMLFAAGVVYALGADPRAPRLAFVLWLLAVWAARHALHAAGGLKNGEPPRYQAIRARHGPRFAWQSLYLVFWREALLAWIVSLPLLGTFASNRPLGWLDYLGIGVWLCGFVSGALGDRLWRHTRLPNYTGELLVWWGLWLVAVSAGAWWSVPGVVLLTLRAVRAKAANVGRKMPTTS